MGGFQFLELHVSRAVEDADIHLSNLWGFKRGSYSVCKADDQPCNRCAGGEHESSVQNMS